MEDAHKDEGSDCHDVSISQGTPKIDRKPPSLRREAWTIFPFASVRRNQPYGHLDLLRLLVSRTVRQ